MPFAYTKAGKEVERPSSDHGFSVEGPLTAEDWREIVGWIVDEAIAQAKREQKGDVPPYDGG